jgi:hypothetical protein
VSEEYAAAWRSVMEGIPAQRVEPFGLPAREVRVRVVERLVIFRLPSTGPECATGPPKGALLPHRVLIGNLPGSYSVSDENYTLTR